MEVFLQPMNKIVYTSMLRIQFKRKTCNISRIDITFDHTLMKYTRNLHVRAVAAYSLEINCSAVGVYISPQIRILHTKNFFANQLKGKPKIPRDFQRDCSICNYITYAMRFRYNRQPCLFMGREITYLM